MLYAQLYYVSNRTVIFCMHWFADSSPLKSPNKICNQIFLTSLEDLILHTVALLNLAMFCSIPLIFLARNNDQRQHKKTSENQYQQTTGLIERLNNNIQLFFNWYYCLREGLF